VSTAPSLRERLRSGAEIRAIFVKTTSHQTVEVLGGTGLDAIVLDAEHAPFGPESLDRCLSAARGVGLPALVRVASARPEAVLQALDMGAAGVLVPHVDCVEDAEAAVRAARYVGGSRGFSPSPRAGGYGARSMAEHLAASDAQSLVIVQIESATAVANAAKIAAVSGVDAVFLGPADLAVSLGVCDTAHAKVQQAVASTCAAAQASGCAIGSFAGDARAVAGLHALGVRFFVIGSDQSLLQRATRQLLAESAPWTAA
jgi:2-keto-3-deoxy-L-rhamnonate aldolase RhmA